MGPDAMQKVLKIHCIHFLGSLGWFQMIFERIEKIQLCARKKFFGRKSCFFEIWWFLDKFFQCVNFRDAPTLSVAVLWSQKWDLQSLSHMSMMYRTVFTKTSELRNSGAHYEMVKMCDLPQHNLDLGQIFDFQNACPPKWCGQFRWNSIELNYSGVLQIDAVSVFLFIRTPLCTTCEHGRKIENSIMGEIDFFRFPKSISSKVVWPFSSKLYWIKLSQGSTYWSSITFCTDFCATCHALWTWSKNWFLCNCGRGRIFSISKMHLLESGAVISGETPLNWTIAVYIQLIQFQLS